MDNSQQLFDKSGGYRKLHSFTFATLIHLATIDFCKRFIPWKEDPLGKTCGQMIGAARSGRQNIIEGSERSSTSKETEIKLTDVARASLAELLGDYEIYIASKGQVPWAKNDPNRLQLGKIHLADFQHTDDSLHDYWVYFQQQRTLFAPWLEHADDIMSANAILVIVKKTMAMLKSQIKVQGDVFAEEGGFRERMYETRTAVKDNVDHSEAPVCPKCGKYMVERTAHTGKHNGEKFWGCSGYPDCKGTRKA